MMDGRRRSMLDTTRNNNFLRKSFGQVNDNITLSYEDYSTVLSTEKQQWKGILKEKKKIALKKCDGLVLSNNDICNLNSSDSKFFADKPDYTEMISHAKKYIETVHWHNFLQESYKNKIIKSIQSTQEQEDEFARKLLEEENEPCTRCNNQYCTKELHKVMVNADHYSDILENFNSLKL